MAYNVVIAGAGRIGSRYLQGLARVEPELRICVVDSADAALLNAEKLWNEAGGSKKHSLRLAGSFEELPPETDLAITAVTADVRIAVVKQILKKSLVRRWVLEKVLAQTVEGTREIEEMLSASEGAWVNTPMHMWSFYKALRKVCATGPISLRYDDVRGLACNAIHYVDFVSRWNGEPVSSIDTSGLDSKWVPAERPGFFDIYGELRVHFSGGSSLIVTSKESDRRFRTSMQVGSESWQIDEPAGRAASNGGLTAEGKCEFQSELTKPLVESILSNGSCELPSLAQSAAQHRGYLSALTEHWNAHMPQKTEALPIT